MTVPPVYASVHGTTTVNAGTINDSPLVSHHGGGRISIRIVDGPYDVWLCGTHQQLISMLDEVRGAVELDQMAVR